MFNDRYRRDDGPPPERPRSEPEIIPPDHTGRRGDPRMWRYENRSGTHRIYVAGPKPLGILVALVLAGLVLAAVVVLVLGLVLFWIPIVVALVAGFLLAAYVRYYWRRLQVWARGR